MAEVSAHLSRLFAGRKPLAFADGVDVIPVRIRLRDVNNVPVPNRQVTLSSDLNVAITQPGRTDEEGRATGLVYSTNPGTANIRAVVEAESSSESSI